MHSILLIIVFSLILNSTQAQSDKKAKVKRYLYHSHGISFQNFENLNARVALYPQYAKAKSSTGTLQFGVFAQRNRWLTSYSINGGNSLSGDRKKKNSATIFLGSSADLGYNIIQSNRLSIYPFAGFGYENYKLKYNRDISALPFDSVLQSSAYLQEIEQPVFNNAFLAYRFGFGMFVTSRKFQQNSIGLQVGYTGSFGEKDWKANKTQILLNSPQDALAKVFASVLIRYQLKKNRQT
jgi:hypothetical protein